MASLPEEGLAKDNIAKGKWIQLFNGKNLDGFRLPKSGTTSWVIILATPSGLKMGR